MTSYSWERFDSAGAFDEAWSDAVLDTTSADRPRAERALTDLYQMCGLEPPAVVWAASPIEMSIYPGRSELGKTLLSRQQGAPYAMRSPLDLETTDPWGWSRHLGADLPRFAQSARSIGHAINWARNAGEMDHRRLPEKIKQADAREFLEAVIGDEWKQLAGWLGATVASRIYADDILGGTHATWVGSEWPGFAYRGQFDWLHPLVVHRNLGGTRLSQSDAKKLECFLEIGRLCGMWTPYEGTVVASERPLVLKTDGRGRLHSEDGPAIVYPDGFTVHAVDGIAMPAWVVNDPERISVEDILESGNAEVRRVLLRLFGIERFVREAGAELVDESEYGRLWRRAMGNVRRAGQYMGPLQFRDEPIVMIEVTDATASADGSRRTYMLRVPPSMRTAKEAVAWTFDMAESQYEPREQT